MLSLFARLISFADHGATVIDIFFFSKKKKEKKNRKRKWRRIEVGFGELWLICALHTPNLSVGME